MITEKISTDIMSKAATLANNYCIKDARPWFDTRDAAAIGMNGERRSCIERLKAIDAAELSLLYRTAYSQHVCSVLTMGEAQIPPSVHFAAAEFAASEMRARLIDAIETPAPSKAKQVEKDQ